MPDITMCSNDECVRKCYRRLATPFIRQSYSLFEPKNKRECKYFWRIVNKPTAK
jgi:hypothetical protein